MKTKEIVKKEFDAVKFMRDTRDKISLEIQNMNFEELNPNFAVKKSLSSQHIVFQVFNNQLFNCIAVE